MCLLLLLLLDVDFREDAEQDQCGGSTGTSIWIAFLIWLSGEGSPLEVLSIKCSQTRRENGSILSCTAELENVHEHSYDQSDDLNDDGSRAREINKARNHPRDVACSDAKGQEDENDRGALASVFTDIRNKAIVDLVGSSEHQQHLVDKENDTDVHGHG